MMMISEVCREHFWVCDYIDDVTWLLRLILPLSLTAALFIYKEVKDIGFSNINISVNHWINYTYIAFSFALLCWIVVLKYNLFVPHIHTITAFSIILLAGWLLSLILIIYHLIKSININSNTKENIKSFENISENVQDNIENINNDNPSNPPYRETQIKQLKKNMKRMTASIEKEYQLLIYKINNNLIEEYEESFDQYNKNVLSFIENINGSKLLVVIENSNEEYFKLYRTILRHNVLLLRSLDSNETLSNTRNIIENFKPLSMNPLNSNQDLSGPHQDIIFKYTGEYYKSLYEIIITLSDKSHNYILSILEILKTQESASGIDNFYQEKDLLTFLTSLLYIAIDKNDLKFVTEVTNEILDLSKDDSVEDMQEFISQMYNTNSLENVESNFQKKKDFNSTDPELEEGVALILLAGITKSVEFGNYGSAGFITKVLVRSVSQPFLLKSIKNIYQSLGSVSDINKLKFDNEYINPDMVDALSINFNFSQVSIEYCFQKVLYLIHFQEKFLIENGLSQFPVTTPIQIKNYIKDEATRNYLKMKLIGLDREYGMIALSKGKSFLEKLFN